MPEEATSNSVNSIHVFLIDDEMTQIELTKLNLGSADPYFTITAKQNQFEAQEIFHYQIFDCIVCDYQMPEMNGVQLCAEIRKTSNIPFIIYTAKGSEEVASDAFAAGVDDYVMKEPTLAHYRILARRIRHVVEKRRAETALQNSKDQLNSMLERVTDNFVAFDANWRYVYVNDSALKNLRKTRDEVVGKVVWDIFPALSDTIYGEKYREAMEKQTPLEFEAYYKPFNMWTYMRLYPSPQGLTIYYQDVTESKRAEVLLSTTLQRLEAHINNSPLAVIEFDTEFRIIRWSEEAERVFGWNASEILGSKISEIRWVYEDDAELVQKESDALFSGQKTRGVNVNRNYRKDGSVIWCQWYSSAIRDASGELTSVLSLVLDVTEYRQSREQLTTLASFPTLNPNPVLDVDPSGNIRYMNPAAESLFPEVSRIRTIATLTLDWAETLSQLQTENGKVLLRDVEINGVWYSLSLQVIPGAVNVRIYAWNIDERKRGEQDLKRARDYLSLLHRHTSQMAGTIELNEVINLTMDAVRGILNFDIGSFHLVEGERVRMVYTQGFKVEGEFVQEVSGPGVIPEAIRTRKSQLVPDVRKSSLYMRGLLPAKEARVSEMTVPVLVDGECIAAINVEGRTVGAFKQGDVELLEVLASHVASALKRIRAVETEKSSKQALKSLNRVLKSSNEELFAVNEKLRKSEWDLQAFNEELQASEEELRTSNEELSTSNEELSATEEELRVANEIQQEYANKLEVMVEQRTAKLKESEQRLRGFMDSTEDGFAIFDSELRLIDVNRVGLELILMGNPPGTTRESLTGKRYSEIFPGVEKSERYAAMERVLKMREPIQWEGVSWVSPDIWHSNTAFPVGSGIGVISRNITKQRRLQLELQRSEVISAVEQMGATVAHDLRGPLGQIVQSVNLIKQDPALTPRMLKLVEENAVRSLKMISDWRSSTREIVPQPVKTDLGVLVNSVIVGTTIPTNVDIHASIEDGLESILVDPDITHRVLDNLVKNAVEAMPQGGNLLIAAKIQGNKVEIRVSDTGVGISEELRGRIFSPLFTTKAGGMGLGLTYCRRAVEAQGGSLDFESKVGFGTTFIMTLPRGKQNIK